MVHDVRIINGFHKVALQQCIYVAGTKIATDMLKYCIEFAITQLLLHIVKLFPIVFFKIFNSDVKRGFEC
jgi:hypothetical protein